MVKKKMQQLKRTERSIAIVSTIKPEKQQGMMYVAYMCAFMCVLMRTIFGLRVQSAHCTHSV